MTGKSAKANLVGYKVVKRKGLVGWCGCASTNAKSSLIAIYVICSSTRTVTDRANDNVWLVAKALIEGDTDKTACGRVAAGVDIDGTSLVRAVDRCGAAVAKNSSGDVAAWRWASKANVVGDF